MPIIIFITSGLISTLFSGILYERDLQAYKVIPEVEEEEKPPLQKKKQKKESQDAILESSRPKRLNVERPVRFRE